MLKKKKYILNCDVIFLELDYKADTLFWFYTQLCPTLVCILVEKIYGRHVYKLFIF